MAKVNGTMKPRGSLMSVIGHHYRVKRWIGKGMWCQGVEVVNDWRMESWELDGVGSLLLLG